MTRPRSTINPSAGEGGGGSDDDDGTTTPSPIQRHKGYGSSYSSPSMLLGLAVLLLAVSQAAAATEATITITPEMIEDFLSTMKPSLERETGSNNDTRPTGNHHPQVTSNGESFDLLLDSNAAPLPGRPTIRLRQSEQTKAEFKIFSDRNCRDEFDYSTFLTWEQDQFAAHLKTNILSSSAPRDASDASQSATPPPEIRKMLRALLEPDPEAVEAALNSLCKIHRGWYDENNNHEKSANDNFENEIVNSVFANMYKRGPHGRLFFNEKSNPIYVTRRRNKRNAFVAPPLEDESFTKEIFRTLEL